MKTFLLFLCFIAVVGAQNATCTSDAANASKQCYLTFLNNFGFSQIPSYQDFLTALQNMVIAGGIQGTQNTCNWFNTLNACLGPAIGGCNSTMGYQQILGLPFTDSEEYFLFYISERFECNEGYNSLLKNYYCFISVEQYHEDEVMQCSDNLTSSLNNNPFNCSYISDYVTCATNVYQKYCGTSGAGFVCTATSLEMEAILPQCTATMPMCPSYNKAVPFHNTNSHIGFVPRFKFLKRGILKN